MYQIFDQFRIIGVSHLSQESIQEVKRTIYEEKPAAVALELCPIRLHALTSLDRPIVSYKSMLKGGISEIAGTLFALIQRKLAKGIGIEPGDEMLIALQAAQGINANIFLIDQDIRFILAKLFEKMTFKEKFRLFCEIFLSFLPFVGGRLNISDLVKNEIEYLHYFKKLLPNAYRVLVEDRDKFMSTSLLSISRQFFSNSKIVVVVGLAHVKGIKNNLEKLKRYEADYAVQ